jgi:predicted ester cyclase
MSADPGQEQIKAMAHRFVLEHNQAGYMKTFDELLAPNCVVHEYLPGVPESMDRTAYNRFIATFPDIHDTVEDAVVGADKVAVRWTGYGTHTGADLMGIRASNKRATVHGIYILRFAQGKIVEVWNNWANLDMMQQFGVLPPPPQQAG